MGLLVAAAIGMSTTPRCGPASHPAAASAEREAKTFAIASPMPPLRQQ